MKVLLCSLLFLGTTLVTSAVPVASRSSFGSVSPNGLACQNYSGPDGFCYQETFQSQTVPGDYIFSYEISGLDEFQLDISNKSATLDGSLQAAYGVLVADPSGVVHPSVETYGQTPSLPTDDSVCLSSVTAKACTHETWYSTYFDAFFEIAQPGMDNCGSTANDCLVFFVAEKADIAPTVVLTPLETIIPEPAVAGSIALGLIGLGLYGRARKRTSK